MKVRHVMEKFFAVMDFIAKCICGACACGFFAIIIWQVISRFFFHTSMNWSDEACRYLFYVMVFAGTVLCINENGHFSIDICTTMLSGKPKKLVSMIVYIVSVVFLIYLAKSGIMLVEGTAGQRTNVLNIPTSRLYAVIPVSSILMIVYTIRVAIEDLFVKKNETAEEGTL